MKANYDKEIIEKYLAGEDAFFDVLVKKYLKSVYNFLFLMTRDRDVLDDLTQDTFVKAWKNIRKFDREKNFKAWLFTIAKNTAYDYFKKKRTIPFSEFRDDQGKNPLENIPEDKILPDKILEREDIAKELEMKLEEIPPHYRILLTMRYLDDLSLEEISQILGKSYNTIKSQHNRALQNLRNFLR